VKYGLYIGNQGELAEPRRFAETAALAEAAGWDGIFTWDHLVSWVNPVVDPWVQVSAAAMVTERIALGVLVAAVPRRRPWKLALEAASVALLSEGRFVLGAGVGAAPDLARFGEEASAERRSALFDEALPLVRRFLDGRAVSHRGTNFAVDEVQLAAPDAPYVPIWVGGNVPRREALRGLDCADGVFPVKPLRAAPFFEPPPPEEVAELRHVLPARIRDFVVWSRGAIEPLTRARAADYDAAGATWWLEDTWRVAPDDVLERVRAGLPG
jgi:alkanesulfonate monooxygenase SsuD/methylene tetrahydromethanopterin reductase-like flavin-dependent oxidoreductase (luciferase family)